MAQSTASQKTLRFREITKRPRTPQAPNPRLHRQDFAWIALFAAITICLRVVTVGPHVLSHPETYLSAATVVFLYFLGFRVRDRATAVIAAALLATSPLFSVAPAEGPNDLLFVLFTIAALALYGAASDSWIILCAMIVASGATIMRPEGILLGAVLLGFMLTEQRPGWVVGTIVYFLLTSAGLAGLVLFEHQHIPVPAIHLALGPIINLFGTQTAIVAWFIWPMLTDLGDPARRARWKPVIVWSALFLCVESLFHFAGYSFESGPFRPVLFLLAAGGIARVLPVIAGDFANPTARYVVAVLAVGTLIYARVRAEWPMAHRLQQIAATESVAASNHQAVAVRHPAIHRAVVTHVPIKVALTPKSATFATAAATEHPGIPHHVIYVPPGALKPAIPAKQHTQTASATMPVVATKVAPPPAVHPIANRPKPPALQVANVQPPPVAHLAPKVAQKPKTAIAAAPSTLDAAAAAAGVKIYTVRRGHVVRRNAWAIRWDIAHAPKKVATKPAPIPPRMPKAAAKPSAKPVVVAKTPARAMPPKPAAKPILASTSHTRPAAPRPKAAVKAPESTPHPIVVIPGVPIALATQAAAAGVPVYYVRHGRNIARTTWSIRWDITHHRSTPMEPRPPAPGANGPAGRPAALAHHAAKPTTHAHAIRMARRPRVVAHPRKAAPRRSVHKKRHRSIWAIRWSATHSAQ